jgi:hypothetical protein
MNNGGETSAALKGQLELPVEGAKAIRLANTVVLRDFVTETVLMEINSGRYYKFDARGGLLLKSLIENGSVESAIASLTRLDPLSSVDELQEELNSLVQKLRSLDLLR